MGPTNPAIRDWANTREKLANREIILLNPRDGAELAFRVATVLQPAS
jgi:hypothetical protein